MHKVARFREFVESLSRLVSEFAEDESRILEDGKRLLADLVGHKDWLPGEFAEPDPQWYQQYLLYLDPWERFSVVSAVWGPRQGTPIYDLSIWGIIGVMDGALSCRPFGRDPDGHQLIAGDPQQLGPGEIFLASPRIGDIHQISNSLNDKRSISIHVYGANIATVKRYIYDPQTGHRRKFLSAYSNPIVSRITQSSLKVLLERI